MTEFQYGFLLISFLAGSLTVLSPCVLPMLPIVMSGSIGQKTFLRPLRIIFALAISVIVFTLLLKVATVFIGVPGYLWRWLSGIILISFGVFTIYPQIWVKLTSVLGFKKVGHRLLGRNLKKQSLWGDLLVGAGLGPIFTSCGPTYTIIVGTSIPASWLVGSVYLLIFVIGLTVCLLAIAFLGQKLIKKLTALNKPGGLFQRLLALVFILIGCLILTGLDRQIESHLIREGWYDWLIEFEEGFQEEN